MSRTDRYAVVGNPIAHSLSPLIHAAFAEQTRQQLEYKAIALDIDGFEPGIRQLQQQGYRGVNVTVPFKREAWELCDRLTSRAETAGAVNTLTFAENGTLEGDNTDGAGLVRDLTANLGISLGDKHILLLGAGGAARGVLEPMLAQSPARLTIANRSMERAEALALEFAQLGEIRAVAYADLPDEAYHVVINATAAGLDNSLPPLAPELLNRTGVCYDMMYGLKAETAFVNWSAKQGVPQVHDGLGMLVEQAAEAFYGWRGLRPDTAGFPQRLRADAL